MPGVPPDGVSQLKKAFKSIFKRKRGNGINSRNNSEALEPNSVTAAQQQNQPVTTPALPESLPTNTEPLATRAVPDALPLTNDAPGDKMRAWSEVKDEQVSEEQPTLSQGPKNEMAPNDASPPKLKLTPPTGEEPKRPEEVKQTTIHAAKADSPPASPTGSGNSDGALPAMSATSGPLEDNPVPV